MEIRELSEFDMAQVSGGSGDYYDDNNPDLWSEASGHAVPSNLLTAG